MNSIDQQKPEVNRGNLSSAEAVDKIKELAGKTQIYFLNTDLKSGREAATRPMSVQQIDNEGNLWFLPDEGYYWDTKHGKMVAFLKTIAGAIIGKTLDDSIQGAVKL